MSVAQHIAGYEVTREGRIFSTAHNWRGIARYEMRTTPNSDGYPSVRLTVDGSRKRYTVHGLVALYHLPPKPSDRHEIRHLDGDISSPHADNLAWGTQKENAEDRERHGRTSRGASHSSAIRNSNQAAGTRAYRARAAIAKAEGHP